MRFATDRRVGPIIAVNGLNDAPCWPSRPFYGFVNKKYFPYFLPKNVKNCITHYGKLNSYNFGIVEDTYKLFALNGVFGVGQFNCVSEISLRPSAVAMATKI